MNKFRVYDKAKQMYDDDDLSLLCWGIDAKGKLFSLENVGMVDCPDCVVEYATGLTDKNGNMTYVGDICKVTYLDKRCNTNGEHYIDEFELIEEVVFEKGAFCFKTMIEDLPMYRPIGFEIYGKQSIKYFEVIGNVHDNPELLEG